MGLEPNEIIARRRYVSARDPTQVLEIQLGKPVRSPGDLEEYSCAVAIKSAENEGVSKVHGIDELQALLLALSYAKANLQTKDSDWRWAGDEEGDVGIDILTIE